jgi:16S rRNA A1518/A1519 N6-dimethyltransferase RsmA/KsgA/DIM1 with predicted DNA glycosylase/AP lyase activity
MFQKEVAERIVAKAERPRHYGRLALLAQYGAARRGS